MKYSTAAPRLVLGKIGAALATVAAVSLVLAASAGAQVFTIDASNPNNLANAIASANANSPGGAPSTNTIVLAKGRYVPPTGMTVTAGDDLTITGAHSADNITGPPANTDPYQIDGSTQQSETPAADFLTVASGATLRLQGLDVNAAGNPTVPKAAIRDNGTVIIDNSLLGSDSGFPVAVEAAGSLTMRDSTIDGAVHTTALLIDASNASAKLFNVTIAEGAQTGIQWSTSPAGTVEAYNTLFVFQTGIECVGGTIAAGTTGNANNGSMDDDGSCNVQFSNDTTADSTFGSLTRHGGPTSAPTGGSEVAGKGNTSLCPRVDQRFFLNPLAGSTNSCDVGSITGAAVRETAAQGPTCGTPSTHIPTGYPNLTQTQYNADPATQTVPANPGASGFGPEAGAPTDIVNDADAINGIVNTTETAPGGIDNGTVALLNPFSAPGFGVLNVKATKPFSGQGVPTHWSFTANDWAGLTFYCH
jgi:hypothetical protein